MKNFTIQIAPVRAPYMREKQRVENTVCKKYVRGKVVYHEFRWNNPKAGRNIMFFDTPDCEVEREPYAQKFASRVQRAFDKAVIRFDNDYRNLKLEDEIVSVYAPLVIAENGPYLARPRTAYRKVARGSTFQFFTVFIQQYGLDTKKRSGSGPGF